MSRIATLNAMLTRVCELLLGRPPLKKESESPARMRSEMPSRSGNLSRFGCLSLSAIIHKPCGRQPLLFGLSQGYATIWLGIWKAVSQDFDDTQGYISSRGESPHEREALL
jgi:hypothetical protein